MASDEGKMPRESTCEISPNDFEDVKEIGQLLIDITTTKADYILPYQISTFVVFICYQINDDMQKNPRNILCVIGFIINGLSNYLKDNAEFRDIIARMTEAELDDVFYGQLKEMLDTSPPEISVGGKKKKTLKRRKRGGMLNRFARLGRSATQGTAEVVGSIGTTIVNATTTIMKYIPKICEIIYVLYNLYMLLHYINLIRVKTINVVDDKDTIAFLKNITYGISFNGQPLLEPGNITNALETYKTLDSELKPYKEGKTYMDEFINTVLFTGGFVVSKILSRQNSVIGKLYTSSIEAQTMITVPGIGQMSEIFFGVLIKNARDDCLSDVTDADLLVEIDSMDTFLLQFAPELADYSTRFKNSMKRSLKLPIKAPKESIMYSPSAPGLTSTKIPFADENEDENENENESENEDENESENESEVGVSGDVDKSVVLKPVEKTGFLESILNKIYTPDTSKQASDFVSVVNRKSVVFSNSKIRGRCMVNSAQNTRSTIELEGKLILLQMDRLKLKFKTIWDMEHENTANALNHLYFISGWLLYYFRLHDKISSEVEKALVRRVQAQAAPAQAVPVQAQAAAAQAQAVPALLPGQQLLVAVADPNNPNGPRRIGLSPGRQRQGQQLQIENNPEGGRRRQTKKIRRRQTKKPKRITRKRGGR